MGAVAAKTAYHGAKVCSQAFPCQVFASTTSGLAQCSVGRHRPMSAMRKQGALIGFCFILFHDQRPHCLTFGDFTSLQAKHFEEHGLDPDTPSQHMHRLAWRGRVGCCWYVVRTWISSVLVGQSLIASLEKLLHSTYIRMRPPMSGLLLGIEREKRQGVSF